jgi:hypothetical protein
MRIFTTLACCLFLVACGQVSGISVTTRPLDIDIARTADPTGVTMLPVQFKVINKDNLENFLSDLRTNQGGNNPVFFSITTRDYENMALNLADMRRYIEQQQSIIIYYRSLTSKHNEQLSGAHNANK